MSQQDEASFMRLAIEASKRAVENGNRPFGATLVRDDKVLHVSMTNESTSFDCTAHAEVALLREAAMKLGREALRGTTVYASGEPCAMCSGAMFWAGVTRVVFAATTQDIIDALGAPYLTVRSSEVLGRGHPPVQVDGPLLREEAVRVLRSFRVE